ncbi:hypothetical protein OHC33_008557 [Knufia fluminis]|uniref:Uncharacterized protein n=1 Tax=Knufia fluminis TaxID=191047 RepID=A0AAN8ER19_9EURO|nr:hypothetical protein OHC33_008557 [Knufia fluminis]
MSSTNSHSTTLTYATSTYASRSSTKAADSTSSATTLNNSNNSNNNSTNPAALGLTPYTAEFLQELLTWRILHLYSPFMGPHAGAAAYFYNDTTLRHINAARLYELFTSERKARRIMKGVPVLSGLACAYRKCSPQAREDAEVYERIAHVAADAGVSCSAVERGLRLLRDFSETCSNSNNTGTATPSTTTQWDDLALTLSEDRHTLKDYTDATTGILRHRLRYLGLSVSNDIIPAVARCEKQYFAKLCRCYATDSVTYILAAPYQRNSDVGVQMVVHLSRSNLRKRGWKRVVSYEEVHAEDRLWTAGTRNRSQESRDTYGTVNGLRRMPMPMPVRQHPHVRWAGMPETETLVDPLRRMKVGEEFGGVQRDSGAFMY